MKSTKGFTYTPALFYGKRDVFSMSVTLKPDQAPKEWVALFSQKEVCNVRKRIKSRCLLKNRYVEKSNLILCKIDKLPKNVFWTGLGAKSSNNVKSNLTSNKKCSKKRRNKAKKYKSNLL